MCWAGVPSLKDDACRDEHLHAPVLRGAHHVLRHVARYVLRHVLRCVHHVLILLVSPKDKRGGAARVCWA